MPNLLRSLAAIAIVSPLAAVCACTGQVPSESPTDDQEVFTFGQISSALTVSLASKGTHTVAAINGALWGWGTNSQGEVGDGSMTYTYAPNGFAYPNYTINNDRYYPAPLLVPSGISFSSVAAGAWHSLALQSNGAVWAWGNNQFKQLGLKTTSPCGSAKNCSSPQIVDNWEGGVAPIITQVVAGQFHNLALDNQGRVWAWGANNAGMQQLGYSTGASTCTDNSGIAIGCSPTVKMIPNFPPVGRAIVAVAAALNYSLALDNAGTVYAWGNNANGGMLGFGDTAPKPTPSAIPLPMPAGVKKIAAGGTTEGQPFNAPYMSCNPQGQCGLVTGSGRDTFMLALVDPDGDGIGTVWKWGDEQPCYTAPCTFMRPHVTELSTVTAIAAGGMMGAARKQSGILRIIDRDGDHDDPDLGTVTSFAVGGTSSLFAVRSSDSQLYAKGENLMGALGIPVFGARDTTVSPGQSYQYTVSAVDPSYNRSALSAPLQVASAGDVDMTPPSVPTGLTVYQSGYGLFLNWSAATDSGSGIAGYELYRDGSTTALFDYRGRPSTFLFWYESSDVPSRTYSYRIRAVDNAGNRSALSAPVSITTAAAPADDIPSAPRNLRASYVVFNRVDLAWDASTDAEGIASYEIFRSGTVDPIGVANGAQPRFSDPSAHPATSYTYTVKAVDTTMHRSPSASIAVSTPASFDSVLPSAPSHLVTTLASSSEIAFSWDASFDRSNVATYEFFRNGVAISLQDVTSAGSNPFLPIGAPRPIALNVASAPTSILINSASVATGGVALAWSPPQATAPVSEYRIYRRVSGSGSFAKIGSSNAGTPQFFDSNLSTAATYDYKVSMITVVNGVQVEQYQSPIKTVYVSGGIGGGCGGRPCTITLN